MTSLLIYRKTIEFAKVIAYDRAGNSYVYGGNWNPFRRAIGTDCSGCVVDELDAAINGTAMAWTRHNLSTESWRPPAMGGSAAPTNGPFGTIMVDSPDQIPASAAVAVALHHGPGGGTASHMWCRVDTLEIETNGDNGTVLGSAALAINDSYANNWWFLPGPIIEDGTPLVTGPSTSATAPPDTLWADVSEFQVPADAAYWQTTYADGGANWNYRWLSIRSNDGGHVDLNFAANYTECVRACNAGEADGFFVYYYWRPGSAAVNNHMSLIQSLGGPHPLMVAMIDLESGSGNPSGDVSSQVNSDYATLAAWLGSPQRVIGYGNTSDLNNMWVTKPAGLQLIIAAYGSNPTYPGKFAHQYTNGQGYGAGLPEGVPPFGNCDMNSADGLSPTQLAAALGLGSAQPIPTPIPIPPPTPPAAPLSNEQMQDLFNMMALTFQQVAGVVPDLPLLPGSPTPMPAVWPASLKTLLA